MKRWRNPNIVSFSHALPDFVSGKRTPRDFLERCLEMIAARDRTIKAFVTLNTAAASAGTGEILPFIVPPLPIACHPAVRASCRIGPQSLSWNDYSQLSACRTWCH